MTYLPLMESKNIFILGNNVEAWIDEDDAKKMIGTGPERSMDEIHNMNVYLKFMTENRVL